MHKVPSTPQDPGAPHNWLAQPAHAAYKPVQQYQEDSLTVLQLLTESLHCACKQWTKAVSAPPAVLQGCQKMS